LPTLEFATQQQLLEAPRDGHPKPTPHFYRNSFEKTNNVEIDVIRGWDISQAACLALVQEVEK
jgi:hypothetical protein